MLRALVLLAALLLGVGPAVAEAPAGLDGVVVRVVDGDTVHVRLGERVEKVRYIGVNTPEIHHPSKGEEPGGRAAHAVNRQMVEGKRVRLELDVQSRDRYGGLLAYVWVGETMTNAELVRLGYAQVMTVPPNVRHQALFLKLQRAAREAGRGLYLNGGPDMAPKPPNARDAPAEPGVPRARPVWPPSPRTLAAPRQGRDAAPSTRQLGQLAPDQGDHLEVGHVEDLEHEAADAGGLPAGEALANLVEHAVQERGRAPAGGVRGQAREDRERALVSGLDLGRGAADDDRHHQRAADRRRGRGRPRGSALPARGTWPRSPRSVTRVTFHSSACSATMRSVRRSPRPPMMSGTRAARRQRKGLGLASG